jgi:hypothetical protein
MNKLKTKLKLIEILNILKFFEKCDERSCGKAGAFFDEKINYIFLMSCLGPFYFLMGIYYSHFAVPSEGQTSWHLWAGIPKQNTNMYFTE